MPPPPPLNSRRPRFLLGLAVLLALGHALLSLLAMRDKSTTSDELAHITGGYTFDALDDYRLQPENGILPQRLQALPSVLKGVHYPTPEGRDWRESSVWQVGHKFFYELGNDHEWMLFTARAVNSLFGAATVLLVFGWTRRLFGDAGAAVAGCFAALSPTMLAHSAIATSDMAMAFFFLASVGAYWRHLQTGGTRSWALSAVVFGLACVAKYSAVLLLPMMAIMALVRAAQPAPFAFAGRTFANPFAKLLGIALSTAAHGVVAVATIWLFFGFRYPAFNPQLPPGEFSMPWQYVLAIDHGAGVIRRFLSWHLLPEGYLYGLAFVVKHAEARGAFLDGNYSLYGWVSFFPKAFFYKTTEALLLATAAAGAFALLRARAEGLRRWAAGLVPFAPLLALFGVYWLFSLTSHLNIGHRHILPTYPVLFIFTGVLGAAVVRAAEKSRRAAWALGALVLALIIGQAATAARAFPHYLAYFNRLSGGPENGYRHLVDSSLDWGQDLPGLAQWLAQNNPAGQRVYLSYFGTGEPDFYGIRATRLPFINAFRRAPGWYAPRGGIYCVGATMLQHVYSSVRGDWTLEREKEYQDLRQLDAQVLRLYFTDPSSRPELLKSTTKEQMERAWTRLDVLRFARLCAYLRARQPDVMIGYSIFIYRLTDDEVDAAVNRSYSAFVDALEKARVR